MLIKYTIIITAIITALLMSCSDNQPTNNNIPNDSTFTQTDRLPVPDFEYWKSFYGTGGEFIYEDPIGNWWTTLNKLKLIGGPVTVTKTTDAHSGKYALRLETKKFGDSIIITGLLMSGIFDPLLLKDVPNYVIEGRPFNKKPIKFSGYFKYLPADGDTCNFYINITKYNTTTGKKDTIAEANLNIWETVTTYRQFDMPLNYYRNDLTPDTIKIAIISSAGGQDYSGHGTPKVGSALLIDDLSLEIPTGTINLMDKKTKSTK